MHKFCEPMEIHFITRASMNSAKALNMAKEVWSTDAEKDGIHELVKTIEIASKGLINVCQKHAYRYNDKIDGATNDA